MMLDTLDKMNKLLGPKHRLSGKGLYMQNENPSLLAIEDLMPLGFRMTDLSGLDLAHSILVLRGLARFHAASVAVCEKEPKQKKMYSRGSFNNQNPSEERDFFNNGTKALSEEIITWPEVKKYSEKIAKLSDHMYQIGIDATKLSENEFNVINHGDCHMKNMLFKYDNDGNPTDHIFLDFQACIYTSPAIDLLYFLNTSLSLDTIENNRDILLNEYFGTLSTTMKQLNCKTKPPTMEELKDTMKRRASFEMVSSFTVLPLMLCSKTEAKDLDEMMSTGTWINPGLKSEDFKKFMIKKIPLYDEWGLLDLTNAICLVKRHTLCNVNREVPRGFATFYAKRGSPHTKKLFLLKVNTVEAPSWLNQCFVEKILRNSEDDNSIQVINMFSKPATSKGDNYTSDIMRITIEFSRDQDGRKITEKKSIIVKLLRAFESIWDNSDSGPLSLFDTEILMMSDTLKKMNKLLWPKHRLSGKGLYMQNKNPIILVMEDLAPLGFRMADRRSGLDLAHSILALRGLARFHAASVAVCEKEPKQKKMYTKGLFSNEYPPEMREFWIKGTKVLSEEIANWSEVKKYSEKIAKLSDHIYQVGLNATELSEDEFNVINHGDYHLNNMLFKYDKDGKPIDHIIVDFQLCVYTSPAIDLLYFFSTSPSSDVIENKKDILLNEYLVSLSSIMKQLNCKTQPPTMEVLKDTLKRRASYEMITTMTILPITMMCRKAEVKDLREVMGTGNPGLKNEDYKKVIIKRLPLYDERGLLDL
ncbi:PREDICTED: uncharacterized protein LOC105460486 [Wasmannia auropunctata]|uniref:uncharacterized protein LOC105460486 n=1 Tax=Wasmannia auropunctata TaxID=64793 RepID=UPI0005EFEBFB|nr:PREDICTED: uncharacterized protein LOC105460486 [Wasmannia auropunctata]